MIKRLRHHKIRQATNYKFLKLITNSLNPTKKPSQLNNHLISNQKQRPTNDQPNINRLQPVRILCSPQKALTQKKISLKRVRRLLWRTKRPRQLIWAYSKTTHPLKLNRKRFLRRWSPLPWVQTQRKRPWLRSTNLTRRLVWLRPLSTTPPGNTCWKVSRFCHQLASIRKGKTIKKIKTLNLSKKT